MSTNLVSVGEAWQGFLDLEGTTALQLVDKLNEQLHGVGHWSIKRAYCSVDGTGPVPSFYIFGPYDSVDVRLDAIMASYLRYTDMAIYATSH